MTPSTHDIKTKLSGVDFSFKLRTYPLVPSFALTVEKIQGATLQGCVLGTLHHPSRTSFPPSLLYVALSRVRKLADLYLTEPLTMADIRPPSESVTTEIARLEALPS